MDAFGWWMIVIHGILLIFFRWRMGKKKRALQLEKAHLLIENKELKGKLSYYKRQLSSKA
jgi:hypothetical protein